MTTVEGRLSMALTAAPPGRSASLASHAPFSTSRRAWSQSSPLRGLPWQPGSLTFATVTRSGRTGGGPGSDLWDRVLVTPRKKDAGFVLSDQTWQAEVWSTFKRQAVNLTAVSVGGSGGATVVGPSSMTYFPGQAQQYTVSLATEGPAAIANLITWTFPVIAGADLLISGTRISAFPHRPDWSEPFRVRKSWLTEIFPGYDGTEQRRSLRTKPRHGVTFRVLTTDPLETASLEALLYGWQARQFGVPIWPERTLLQAPVIPGATSLQADTSLRRSFEVGGFVLVWTDFQTWEAFEIIGLPPGEILLSSQVTKSWAVGARVVPMRRGFLQPKQGLGRPANWLSSGTFSFDCAPV